MNLRYLKHIPAGSYNCSSCLKIGNIVFSHLSFKSVGKYDRYEEYLINVKNVSTSTCLNLCDCDILSTEDITIEFRYPIV